MPSGVYVCGQGLKVDRDRVLRIVRKTIKGLFYHEFGFRFPGDCGMLIGALTPLEMTIPREAFEKMLSDVAAMLTSPIKQIGSGSFTYRYGSSPSSRYQTVWVVVFGGFLAFHVFTDRRRNNPQFA